MTDRRRAAREARDKISEQLRLEGLRVAYERGIKLLKDDTVPATAQAALVRVMLQAGGVLNAPEDDRPGKELHEMTADEVAQALAETQEALATGRGPSREGVFG